MDWSKENRGRLWENDNGTAYVGEKTGDFAKAQELGIKLSNPKYIKYGLKPGSSDLIGFEFINGIPIFCSVEVKTKAYPRLSDDQKKWLYLNKMSGCRVYIARESENGYDLSEWNESEYKGELEH